MSFQQIKGQDTAIKILKNYLKTDRLSSSYIFNGPDGIGKTTAAKIFAKTMNCLWLHDDSCDKCISCQKIDKSNHPDIHFLKKDQSGWIKIDDIRIVQRELSLKPVEAKKKVFIIDEIEFLTAEAANCLLKSLEEPPQNTIFILITAHIKNIFPTIVSRCQKINFLPLSKETMKNIFVRDYNFDQEKSQFLAYFYEGRLGKAIKENFNGFNEKNRIINAFLNIDSTANLEIKEFQDKEKFRKYILFLLTLYRDIWFTKLGLFGDLINSDLQDKIINLKNDYTFLELENKIQLLSDISKYLDQNINPKLLVNILKINLCKK